MGVYLNAWKLRVRTKRKYILPKKVQQFRGNLISLSSAQKHKFILKKADILERKKGGKWVAISYYIYRNWFQNMSLCDVYHSAGCCCSCGFILVQITTFFKKSRITLFSGILIYTHTHYKKNLLCFIYFDLLSTHLRSLILNLKFTK